MVLFCMVQNIVMTLLPYSVFYKQKASRLKNKINAVAVSSNMYEYKAVCDYIPPTSIGNALFVLQSVCVSVDHFYIVLFSALEQTCCTRM